MTDGISPRAPDSAEAILTAVREIPPHCATCLHYVTDPAVMHTGECRLYYPGLVGTGDNLRTAYPTVAATDYCGAHPDAASLG